MWDKVIIRALGGYSMFELGGLNTYARALGLSSCDKPDDLVTHAVLVKYPELVDIVWEFRDDFTKLYKYCNHRECGCSSSLILVLTGDSQLHSSMPSMHRLTRR